MTSRLAPQLVLGLSVLALVHSSAGAFVAEGRWERTATDGQLAVVVNPPTPGVPATLTWSLVPDGTLIPGNESGTTTSSELIAFLDSNFGAGSGGDFAGRPWFSIFQDSFQRLSDLSGLSFVYEPNDDGAQFSRNSAAGALGVRGDIRLSAKAYAAGSNTLAANYSPGYGDMLINTNQVNYFTISADNHRRFRNTLMHEVMHGIGLSHVDSNDSVFLIEPRLADTIDGPQLDDLLGIQRLYGDAYEKNGGNDSPALAIPLGVVDSGATLHFGTHGGEIRIAADEVDFLSIDDDSDVDYFSFTIAEPSTVTLTLAPQGIVYAVGPQGGEQVSVNSAALSDLSLSLFDAAEMPLFTAAETGLGGSEAIVRQLDAGAYYFRVAGAQDEIQLYTVSVAAAPLASAPADFNHDGYVDAVDLLLWQEGIAAPPLDPLGPGDADGNSIVDGADFLLWQRQYAGPPSPAGTAIPEPHSFVTAMMLAALLAGATRRGLAG